MPVIGDDSREQIIDYVARFSEQEIPEAGIFDKPCCCVGINEDWIPFIDGIIHVLTYPSYWVGTDEEKRLAIDQILELQIAMGSCRCGGSRKDGLGVTELIRQDLKARFDAGGIDAIAPDRPDTFFDGDSGDTGGEIPQRQVALCWASHDYILTLAEEGFNLLLDVDLATAAVGFGLSVLLSPIVGLAFTAATRLLIELAEDAITSKVCVDAVGCCMYENLKGLAVNQANFSSALDSCAGLDPVCVPLVNLMKTTLADEKNWLAFVAKMGGFFEGASQDLADCGCEVQWEQAFDFTASDGGWVTDPQDGSGWGATYIPGVGWQNSGSGAQKSLAIKYTIAPNDGDFDQVKASYILGSALQRVARLQTGLITDTNSDDVTPDGVYVTFDGPFATATQTIHFLIQSTGAGSSHTLTSVSFNGFGVNPFV